MNISKWPEASQEATVGRGLVSRETTKERLDRQISEVEAHLENLKYLRELLNKNPILEEFHNALRNVGF